MPAIAFETDGFRVTEAGQADEPAEFLPVFNSNPDFLDASTLHTGVRAFTEEDAAQFLWQNEVMENSHCLAIRANDRLVGTATVLVPHPSEQQPWIGLLLIDLDAGFDVVAAPVLGGLERTLAAAGWSALYVAPMTSQQDTISWWRSQGYLPVGVRSDNDKREVEVHRKALAGSG